jgi:hypothetical protein
MKRFTGFKFGILLLIFPLFAANAKAQFSPEHLRVIPVAGVNFGSQSPIVGSSIGLMLNYNFSRTISAGFGLDYMSDIGTGEHSFPLYLNLRSNFSSPVLSKPAVFLFMLRSGADIRRDQYFKTGFFTAVEIAYRWQKLGIRSINLPAFYTGAEFIYNRSSFEDSYRGYLISDGYLTQIIFQLKLSVEIPNKNTEL